MRDGTLKVLEITKSFSKKKVLINVSLEVKRGEVVGLLGPNGAGKTTCFYIIMGNLEPDSGRVFMGDEDITALPMFKRGRAGLGYLPQEPTIFRRLNVQDNLLAILEFLPLSRYERFKKLEEFLDSFSLSEIRKRKAYQLSGGERRRVEIARALLTEPSILLLDEPFAGIDPLTVSELQSLIRRLKEMGIGLLITDHNVRDTLKICDRAYIIDKGSLLLSGNPQEIVSNIMAKKAYLGDDFKLD